MKRLSLRLTRKWTYVPLWVELIHLVMEGIDYKVLSPISSWLIYRRIALIDHYCQCEKCLERDQKQPGWRP